MNIVIVGHVDHGKSTVIGRLLADTGSLPEGKLAAVKGYCQKNARPFEYAFLLDALKDEQAQGITIDTARCFFKTNKRDYIIIDAPGHIEFLKNMVTGASRAEAALLVIDAQEGIKENSKRHGQIVSMLGIRQVVVLVNKMDLVNYGQDAFNLITQEFTEFLHQVNIQPVNFIPISAFNGDNITTRSANTLWYSGPTVLEQLEGLANRKTTTELPLRMPVQDIYKFTAGGDKRRIVAGTILSGAISSGDQVVFLPSHKKSIVKSIEGFNIQPRERAAAGEAVGITLETQIYIKPGELMVKVNEKQPAVSSQIKVNLFWVGKAPLVKNKNYKLKIGTTRIAVQLVEILNIIDATELNVNTLKEQVERHDVAECIFETASPIAFDPISVIELTGRFVIVDNYEISGGGIIIEAVSSSANPGTKEGQVREILGEKGNQQALKRNGLMRQVQPNYWVLRLRMAGGQIQAEQLLKVAEIAQRYGQGSLHLTARQSIEIPFIKLADLEVVKKEFLAAGLQPGAGGARVRTITACQGSTICARGLIETTALAKEFDQRYYGRELPHKFKLGITGCSNNCLKAEENDLGVKGGMQPEWVESNCNFCGICAALCRSQAITVDKEKAALVYRETNCHYCGRCVKACPRQAWKGSEGFLVYFGGLFGNQIAIGKQLLPIIFSTEELHQVVETTLAFFKKQGKAKERFRNTLNRVGWKLLQQELDEVVRR